MLKTSAFAALAFLFGAAPALAQTTITTSPNGTLTSTQIGSTTITTGTLNGQSVSTTSTQIGSTTVTNGTIGSRPVSTTSTTVGGK